MFPLRNDWICETFLGDDNVYKKQQLLLPNTSKKNMDIVYIITLLTSFFFVLLVVLIALKGLKNSQNNDNVDDEDDGNVQRHQTGRLRQGVSGLRNRGRTNRHTNNIEQDDDDEFEEIDYDDNGVDEDQDEMREFPIKGKIGAKKARKLEMKAEKKLARERELQEREERKRMMEEQEKQRKIEEEKIAAEEKAKV